MMPRPVDARGEKGGCVCEGYGHARWRSNREEEIGGN